MEITLNDALNLGEIGAYLVIENGKCSVEFETEEERDGQI